MKATQETLSTELPRYSMLAKYSLINQLSGRIAVISVGDVNVEVVLLISDQETVVATMGLRAFDAMSVKLNEPVIALVRENAILLSSEGCSALLSTRNSLACRIESVRQGSVNTEVILNTPGNDRLFATITISEWDMLKVQPGDMVWANFKASDVILATAHGHGHGHGL